MTLSVNDIVTRARAFSVSNNAATLTGNPGEMIARVSDDQMQVFQAAAEADRYFATIATAASADLPANRTVDLAGLAAPCERIVWVTRADGVLVNPVDFEDQRAALPPRYYLVGQQIIAEVASDWGASGPVALTVGYAFGAAPLDPLGGLAQTLVLPDRYGDVLVARLAAYLAAKDTGRAPEEVQRLDQMAAGRLDLMLKSMAHFEGIPHRRFVSPRPAQGSSS